MSAISSPTVEPQRAEPPAALLVDSAGNVLNADEVSERLLRRSADDICSQRVTDLFSGLVKHNESLAGVAADPAVRFCFADKGDGRRLAVDVSVRRFPGRNTSLFLLTFEEKLEESNEPSFHQLVLDAVDTITAVVDDQGILVYVNERWLAFVAENGGNPQKAGIGAKYSSICENIFGVESSGGRDVGEALRDIVAGDRKSFQSTYPCQALRQRRWFQVRGRRLEHQGRIFVVISYESIDELMRVEEHLALKSERLEDAARIANLGYFERRIGAKPEIQWSAETAQIMGFQSTRTDVELAEFRRLIHPEDRDRIGAEMASMTNLRRPNRAEFRIIRPDGEVRWLHVISRALVGPQGELEGFFGSLQDITRDRMSGHELERNQTQFRAIFELAQDGIAVIDFEGRIGMANQRFQELFGEESTPMIGRRIYEFLEPSCAELVNRRISARLRGEPVEPIVTFTLANGTQRTVRTSLRQVPDADGASQRAILFATDLTEIIDARSTLDITRDRFQRALEVTNTLVSDQDTNLRFVRVYNGHFYQDPIGKRDDELLPANCAGPIVQLKQSVIDSGKSARGDVLVVRGDVNSYFDLCVDPMFDENNRVSGITCVAVDITDRVNTQASRHEHNERMVAELELKNQALEAARFDADQANIAKSRFLAVMSHEIRTPLNGVLGMTGVLLDILQDSAQREIVEMIRTSGDALLTIINDILDFSKIEAGLMELEEHPFAIRHCLDDVIDLIGPQARKKFIELAFVVDSAVPIGIFGDVTRLRQVLVNLVGNAAKFTDAGEVVVEVKVADVLPNGELKLHFSVRDTGIGIAAERMGRLFQTFSQVDVSINRKYGGTGLGLAICKRLVELMGGRIWVESTTGVGTTFHFTIRTKVAADVTSDVVESIASARRDLEGKRALVVDDNAITRRVLSEYLQALGMIPTTVQTAEQALDLLRREPDPRRNFAVIFIDLEMPEVNGYQLVSAIRADPRLLDRPLVLLTASDAAPTQVRRRWQAQCLSKPVKLSTLFESVMRALLDSPHVSSRGPRSIPIDSTLGMRHPLRILLAEDNVINQKVALLLLERAGYRADVAANGREVLDAVMTKAYDVILMDVQMPEMDGIEAARRLRGPGPWLGKPRIIAMTADVMQEGREACLAVGMDDFVAKPIRIPELMKTLEKCAIQKNASGVEETWMAGTEAQLLTTEDVIIDEGAFAALRSVCELEGDGALESLVSEFIHDSKRMLNELAASAERGDTPAIIRLAHTLKGTSGAFGSVGFSQRMEIIEKACRELDLSELASSVEMAIAEHSRLVKALQGLCGAPVT